MKNAISSNHNKVRLSRLWWYLFLVIMLSAFCYITLDVLLLPYSIEYSETGKMTAGYFLYTAIGLLLSTPTPFVAVLIISLFIEKIGIKQMFRNIFRTENKMKTILITGGFCFLAFIYAILFGIPNGSPWYMFPLGFLIMIPFVGIAEETGWRGLLQPELDQRISYPFSVLLTAAIWFIWHFPVFIDPTSNHYGDSVIGFGITIFIWALALAAIYKSTKSVIACALYHAFIDAIGAVYDWNTLFDSFPGSVSTNVYRGIWLIAAVVLWFAAEKEERHTVL
ncbi:MAG: CPBP family intramembrane metalloprotease [Anaerolineaceae bacterium]|nr:CPBP family intramembrane metalloprotease [Anaerolineaceae bacterium]